MEQITIIYNYERGEFVALATVYDPHYAGGCTRQVFAAFAQDYDACAEEAKLVMERRVAMEQHQGEE